MKQILIFLTISLFASCATTGYVSSGNNLYDGDEKSIITQSLFSDKNSTISEENIQKILEGTYRLPEKLRVAIVKLESKQFQRNYYWTNEEYLKTQQSYIDLMTEKLIGSNRVTNVFVIPDLLTSNNPSFSNIRESAVRTQADIVVVYSINSEIYSKYKFFSTDIKAFATTQFILLDVRTGLIPFSQVVTKDFQSQKQKKDFDELEARNRVKNEAVLLTLNEIGDKLTKFLNNN